jgi:2-methylcitrate dehydratase PrpD
VKRVVVATTKLGDEVTRFAGSYASSRPDLTPIGASFDLGLAVAIALHAGQFTGEESRPEWLEAHASALRTWYSKISIEHDPELTMRVLDGARAIPAGREALSKLGVAEWAHIIRCYREQYGSTLLRPKETLGWARAIVRRLRSAAPHSSAGEAIPLYFPNRVSVELTNGGVETASIDLPSGSMASPRADEALFEKFFREAAPMLGAHRAREAFDLGLDIESVELARFVRAVTAG